VLAGEIDKALPQAENKIWHAHPVWFLEGNPIVGYSKLKSCVRLLFWSGQSFDEKGLKKEGKFKAAEARYTAVEQVDRVSLRGWLKKSIGIQWDYKNIVRNSGQAGPAQVVPANGELWALKDRFSIISLVHHGHHFFLFFLVHPFQEKSP